MEVQASSPVIPPARSSTIEETTRLSNGPTPASQKRGALKPGLRVAVVSKEDQPTGQLTIGIIARLLTNSQHHPRGCKVMLTTGVVGRVQQVLGVATGDGLSEGA
jgi:uncharacterized repeat protein (TIGR03833 family)